MLDAIQTKIAVVYVDIPPTEIEEWVVGGKKDVEYIHVTKPLEIKEQY